MPRGKRWVDTDAQPPPRANPGSEPHLFPFPPPPYQPHITLAVQGLIPTPQQKFTNDEASVSLDAASVDDLLQAMEGRYPGILARLCDESGKLRRFLNVYVNSEDIRFLDHQATALTDGDEVSIVPAVAGG